MTAKTTGAEFKRFHDDKTFWPDDFYVEADLIRINGVETDSYDVEQMPDNAKVEIICGSVMSTENDSCVEFVTFFRRWRKAQTTRSVVVEADVSKLDAVIAAVKAAGGRVIS